MKSLGQIAFETYVEAGGITYDGKPIPGWDAVSEKVRRGWSAAASSVLAAADVAGLPVTVREVAEIKHAIFYAKECNHGTAGHDQIMLIAKLSEYLGFSLELTDEIPVLRLYIPDGVEVTG